MSDKVSRSEQESRREYSHENIIELSPRVPSFSFDDAECVSDDQIISVRWRIHFLQLQLESESTLVDKLKPFI